MLDMKSLVQDVEKSCLKLWNHKVYPGSRPYMRPVVLRFELVESILGPLHRVVSMFKLQYLCWVIETKRVCWKLFGRALVDK
jgi:hypothetical protein